jgi:hypothetical protein
VKKSTDDDNNGNCQSHTFDSFKTDLIFTEARQNQHFSGRDTSFQGRHAQPDNKISMVEQRCPTWTLEVINEFFKTHNTLF